MKYKDYYAILGVARDADTAAITKAYRRLARKYHPDVSKEAGAEERFKEVAEAYQTLKDADKRAAYDQLGTHVPGQEFEPPPDWRNQHAEAPFSAEDLDLSELFAHLRRGRGAGPMPLAGEDYEVGVALTLEQAYQGAEIELSLQMPEYDATGMLRRVPHTIKVRVPKGATDGQRLRLAGKGGKGFNGGRNGDLYLNIALQPHALFRPDGHDLYLELPLAPWEAVLGASVEVPTPGGTVRLKVPAGTHAGQRLRLPRRGLPKPRSGEGDLYAVVQIVVPTVLNEQERALYSQLASSSAFNPRGHFAVESHHASH
jgi:curved DNA-binding protein